jgi:hypothetical protein
MDMQPKPKTKTKKVERPRPRPIAKNSQRQVEVPNVAVQRDLTTDKGPSTKKSNRIGKFLLVFFAAIVLELESFRSRN